MKKISSISKCPSCDGDLHVHRMQCHDCGLSLEGEFTRDPLQKLGAEDLRFVRLFLYCEGSIRDMEKALGVSYPTVKARLNQIKGQLEVEVKSQSKGKTVLDQLSTGEMDYETALKLMKGESDA